MQHDFLGHMMPFALESAPCDANSIVNGTIALLSQGDQNEVNMTFWSCDTIGTSQHHMMLMALSIVALHFLCLDDQSEVQMTFWSCNAIGASVSVTWCQWHYCILQVMMIKIRCHSMPLALVLTSHDAVGICNAAITLLRSA